MRPIRDNILVIGVGNDHRSDDGVALWVARRLLKRNVAGLKVLELPDHPLGLLDAWAISHRVYIVDAESSTDCRETCSASRLSISAYPHGTVDFRRMG